MWGGVTGIEMGVEMWIGFGFGREWWAGTMDARDMKEGG